MFSLSRPDLRLFLSRFPGTGLSVAVTAEDFFYNLDSIEMPTTQKIEEGTEITDEGVEKAFEFVAEVSGKSKIISIA